MKIAVTKDIKGRILDIGGGGEGVIGRLFGVQVVAVDKYQQELDEAPDGFEKVLMDATELGFEDGSFDNVTFFYTLMYMHSGEQRKAISEAARVLKRSGNMYIWDADIDSAYPEPFYAEVEVDLPDAQVRTTYGVVKTDGQTAGSISRMCRAAGLALVSAEADAGRFYLHFKRGG